MALISWWMQSERIGGRNRENLRISITKSGAWHYFAFRLTGTIIDQAGLSEGDRLDILVDPQTGEGRLQKVTLGGWKLQVLSQRTRNAYIRVSTAYGLGLEGRKLPVCCPVQTEDGAVIFQLPTHN